MTSFLDLKAPRQRILSEVDGTLFFRATDGVSGAELWKSDGTDAGTMLVRDIFDGPPDSTPSGLSDGIGSFIFLAQDAVRGRELWKSDGTEAGTLLIKDIDARTLGAIPIHLTDAAGTLYFSATDGITGHELWRSDGTEIGTTFIKDIYAGPNDSILQFGHRARLGRRASLLHRRRRNPRTGTVAERRHGGGNGSPPRHPVPDSMGARPEQLTEVKGVLFFSRAGRCSWARAMEERRHRSRYRSRERHQSRAGPCNR